MVHVELQEPRQKMAHPRSPQYWQISRTHALRMVYHDTTTRACAAAADAAFTSDGRRTFLSTGEGRATRLGVQNGKTQRKTSASVSTCRAREPFLLAPDMPPERPPRCPHPWPRGRGKVMKSNTTAMAIEPAATHLPSAFFFCASAPRCARLRPQWSLSVPLRSIFKKS